MRTLRNLYHPFHKVWSCVGKLLLSNARNDDLSIGNLSYKIKHAENTYNCLSDLLSLGKPCLFFSIITKPKLTIEMIDSDINALILDYLTTEGYPSAAAKFSKEANLSPRREEESVKARQQIQHSIHMGSIQDAIEALNDLEPQVSLHIFILFGTPLR